MCTTTNPLVCLIGIVDYEGRHVILVSELKSSGRGSYLRAHEELEVETLPLWIGTQIEVHGGALRLNQIKEANHTPCLSWVNL
jgi:hypothetical protein